MERIPLNEKVHLLCKYVRFLGMINGNGLVIPCPEKVISIVCLERPTDVKELQGFLGNVNWFRKHIASHAQIQFPLNQLTRKLERGGSEVTVEGLNPESLDLLKRIGSQPEAAHG